MRHLALLAALSLAACVDDEPHPYAIAVDWTTESPPDGTGMVFVGAGDNTLDADGFTGSLTVTGETTEAALEVCVALGRRSVQIVDGREVALYEPLDLQCRDVEVTDDRVRFDF